MSKIIVEKCDIKPSKQWLNIIETQIFNIPKYSLSLGATSKKVVVLSTNGGLDPGFDNNFWSKNYHFFVFAFFDTEDFNTCVLKYNKTIKFTCSSGVKGCQTDTTSKH